MSSLQINLISAVSEDMGIGSNGDLPWKLTNELAYFHRMTIGPKTNGRINVVIMGSKTYYSNPVTCRPFKSRLNIVLSRKKVDEDGVVTCTNWDEAISYCRHLKKENLIEKIWVIGGHYPYKLAMESDLCHRIYLTRILDKFNCDVFFPKMDLSRFHQMIDPKIPNEIQEENGVKYKFEIYQKIIVED